MTTNTSPNENTVLLAGQKSRRSQREGAQSAKAAAEKPVPITEAAGLGLPEAYTIGNPADPLRIKLCAPVIAKGKALYVKILQNVPDVILGAAITDPTGKGLDLDAVVEFWNQSESLMEPVTIDQVERELGRFTENLFQYDLETTSREDGHVLDQIADVVWELASGWNEGLTRDALPGLLLNHLTPAQYTDLIRSVFRACRGCDTTYESDVVSRFTSV